METLRDRSQSHVRALAPRGWLHRLNLSLRARLVLLLLVGVVPVTVFSLADEYADYQNAFDAVSREKLLLSRSMAITIDDALQQEVAAMQVLAGSLRGGDLLGFRAFAEAVIAEQFPGARIEWLRENGQQILNTAVPPGGVLPARTELETVRRVLATGRPVVSDLFRSGGGTVDPAISIDVPVRDADGRVTSVLSLLPGISTYTDLITRHHPPARWQVTVLDRKGVVVAQTAGPDRQVGQPLDSALLAVIQAQREGTVDMTARDGSPLMATFTRPDASGWTVIIGVPRAEFAAPVFAATQRTLVFGAIFLLFGLMLAMMMARRIAEPIGTLRELAVTTSGEAVLPPQPTGLAETDEVAAALWASQNQRQRSEQRYRTLFDANPQAICVYDLRSLQFIEVNDAIVRRYGWSRAEMLEMTLYDVCAPEDVPRLRRMHESPLHESYTLRHWRKDGERFETDSVVRVIEIDGRRVGLALSEDITDQVATRARLAEAIQAFPGSFRLYDSRERLIMRNDKDWIPADANFRAAVGETAEATVRAAAEAEADTAAIGRREDWYRERLAQFRRGETDAEIRTRDGRWHQLLERRTADGGTISVRLDITERKLVEDQLRQAQKMETLGQLTGGIAHDFNNSLAVVMGNIEDILDTAPPDSDIRTAAEIALHATEQAAGLTNRLLGFSRQQPLSASELDVGAVVGDLQRILQSSLPRAVDLTVSVAPDTRRCQLDRTQLEAAVMNLVVNARDAVAGSGTIEIATEGRQVDAEEAAAFPELRPGQWVVVSVSDDGSGMPEAVRARIFEPFFTTKPVGKGTGLGLSQIHGFVAQSGGFITVRSVPGQGTSVSLHFPALI